MKVTKYPHRYSISLSAVEFEALKELVDRGKGNFTDESQFSPLPTKMCITIRSARWSAVAGPLSIDVEKPGRGGYGYGKSEKQP